MIGCKYGTHRVIEPKGVLQQTAYKISNDMDTIYDSEIFGFLSIVGVGIFFKCPPFSFMSFIFSVLFAKTPL